MGTSEWDFFLKGLKSIEQKVQTHAMLIYLA